MHAWLITRGSKIGLHASSLCAVCWDYVAGYRISGEEGSREEHSRLASLRQACDSSKGPR